MKGLAAGRPRACDTRRKPVEDSLWRASPAKLTIARLRRPSQSVWWAGAGL